MRDSERKNSPNQSFINFEIYSNSNFYLGRYSCKRKGGETRGNLPNDRVMATLPRFNEGRQVLSSRLLTIPTLYLGMGLGVHYFVAIIDIQVEYLKRKIAIKV